MVGNAPPPLHSRPLGRQLCFERFAVDVADRTVREAERVRSALLGFVLVLFSLAVQLSPKLGYLRLEPGYLGCELLDFLLPCFCSDTSPEVFLLLLGFFASSLSTGNSAAAAGDADDDDEIDVVAGFWLLDAPVVNVAVGGVGE